MSFITNPPTYLLKKSFSLRNFRSKGPLVPKMVTWVPVRNSPGTVRTMTHVVTNRTTQKKKDFLFGFEGHVKVLQGVLPFLRTKFLSINLITSSDDYTLRVTTRCRGHRFLLSQTPSRPLPFCRVTLRSSRRRTDPRIRRRPKETQGQRSGNTLLLPYSIWCLVRSVSLAQGCLFAVGAVGGS